MPILVNKQSGLAEDLTPDQAHAAVYAGTHDVPLVDENGQIGSAPFPDAQSMVSSGKFAQPNPDQLNHMLRVAQNSQPSALAKTFAEGAAAATTGGLSTPLEISTGMATPQDINERRELNPNAYMAGQMTGLLGGLALPGGGEAGALKALGEGAEGLAFGKVAEGAAQGIGNKLARGAVRLGTEGAGFQAGDELSHHFSDPDRTAAMAAADIGMAALTTPIIGGAFEGAAGLFKATKANELQHLLEQAKGHIDAAKSGMDTNAAEILAQKPELQGAMNDSPYVQRAVQGLLNSTSNSGVDFETAINDLHKEVSEGAVKRMGFTLDEIEGAKTTSDEKAGEQARKIINENINGRLEPVSDLYDRTNENYDTATLYPATRKDLADQLSEFAAAQSYDKAPSSMGNKIMNQLAEELPLQKTANDIRKYAENIKDQLSGYENSYLRRNVVNILEDAADKSVITKLGETEGPEAVQLYQNAKSGYRDIMGDVDELADRLKIGKYKGAKGALNNLSDLTAEQVLSRLSKTNDAALTRFLEEKFPDISKIVRESQLRDMARDSVQKNGFNLGKFVEKLENLPPEARQSIVGDETYGQLRGDQNVLDSIKKTINPSGTKKASSDFMRQALGGLGGYSLGMIGGPKLALLMGLLGRGVSDIPDAVRLAFLRSVGGGQSADAMAFRAVAEQASRVYRSMSKIDRGVKSIISGSGGFTVDSLSDRKKQKLEDMAEMYQDDPTKIIDNNAQNHLATYEPDHASAQTAMVSRAMQAILDAKPRTQPAGILDQKIRPSKMETANYLKTIHMVENPMLVLQRVSHGTLTPSELGTFTNVFPGLHDMLKQKFTDQLIDMKSKGKTLPYKNRLSLSMFMGMPLDSTMSPQAITSNQPTAAAPEQNQAEAPRSRGSMKALDKLAGNYMTPGQNRDNDRAIK